MIDLERTNAIGREHFHRPQERPDAVYLDDVGRTLLVQRYESMLQTKVRLPGGEQTPLRRVILLQAQAIARIVRGEQEQYTGFGLNN